MNLSLPATVALLLAAAGGISAGPPFEAFWNVDDLKPGLKGTGLTVLKGTKIEEFDVEILGVLKNTAPGRDMVIGRLSGLGLEKTGVIAGMSGSPITIDGKLVGAVAYAWQFGKEPIAGITPFSQMRGFVQAFEARDGASEREPRKLGLNKPLTIGGHRYTSVVVADGPKRKPFSGASEMPQKLSALGVAGDEMWMLPLQTPVAATGFSAHSLKLFREQFGQSGLLPVMGGATPAKIADEEKNVTLQPGAAMSMAMVTGDFDMSGIGTVTHVDGDRVYGWGHPFMGLGACEFPMMTGYIHTVFPRQTVSFKMGSPLKQVGVVSADVSTCIAGRLGVKADMIPVKIGVRREVGELRTFNVRVVRQRSMLQALLFTVLTNAVDMEGDLPDEMTADLELKIELEGRPPIVLNDVFSGATIAGGRAPTALYFPISQLVATIHNNPYGALRITGIDCQTVIRPGRITAEVESVELDADTVAPGETLKATDATASLEEQPCPPAHRIEDPQRSPRGRVHPDDFRRFDPCPERSARPARHQLRHLGGWL